MSNLCILVVSIIVGFLFTLVSVLISMIKGKTTEQNNKDKEVKIWPHHCLAGTPFPKNFPSDRTVVVPKDLDEYEVEHVICSINGVNLFVVVLFESIDYTTEEQLECHLVCHTTFKIISDSEEIVTSDTGIALQKFNELINKQGD